MANASRAIPWKPQIPFHVRIVGKDIALIVHGRIVLIAKTHAVEFVRLFLQIESREPTSRCQDASRVTASIPLTRQQQIFRIGLDSCPRTHLGHRQGRVIACDRKDFLTVARVKQGVVTMFAPSIELGQ